jgi:hypothetical protein
VQAVINRVFWEGGRPLLQIENLHALLTGTSLQALPLWLLGSDAVKHRIAEAAPQPSGAVAYEWGLHDLSVRDYTSAVARFEQAERLGLRSPLLGALLTYSLSLTNHADEARKAAAGIQPRTDEEIHFWRWMGQQFDIGPFRSAK